SGSLPRARWVGCARPQWPCRSSAAWPSNLHYSPMSVLRPTRVYFDTANLQDLAERDPADALRTGFDRLVTEGVLVPVLSFIHVIEIAKKSDPVRHRIVRFLAPHVDARRVSWVRSGGPLHDMEFHRAVSHEGDGRLAADEVFGPRLSAV